MKKIMLMILVCSCAFIAAAKTEKPAKPAKQTNKAKPTNPADTDKDGKISLAEFTALKKALSKPPKEEKIKSMFEQKDTDHDGFLSMEEMKGTLPIILD